MRSDQDIALFGGNLALTAPDNLICTGFEQLQPVRCTCVAGDRVDLALQRAGAETDDMVVSGACVTMSGMTNGRGDVATAVGAG